MRVLCVVPEAAAGSGVFADEAVTGGHTLEEWRPSQARLRRPLAHYDALVAFGGAMHADQEDEHPWLRNVLDVLREALDRGLPTLGVCLGAQILARAAGGDVGPAPQAEWGWDTVELTDAARDDLLLGGLPGRLDVFQWHSYRFRLPPGGVELAHSPVGPQAFRLGSAAWGVQWHPEVTGATVLLWAERYPPCPGGVDLDGLRADVLSRMATTNGDGRALFSRFLRAGCPSSSST